MKHAVNSLHLPYMAISTSRGTCMEQIWLKRCLVLLPDVTLVASELPEKMTRLNSCRQTHWTTKLPTGNPVGVGAKDYRLAPIHPVSYY